jgi:hypothetical protein
MAKANRRMVIWPRRVSSTGTWGNRWLSAIPARVS